MSKTSNAFLFIGLCVLGGSLTFAGFSAVENNKLKSDYTKLNNQYEIIKKGYDEQQELIISKDTTIEDLKRQLEELKSQQPTTLTTGLYETGTDTLIKSWEQLIADGDITITNGHLECGNKNLSGDLVCGKVEDLTYLGHAFESCQFLTSIDLQNLDTSNVTSLSAMFYGCSSLTNVNFEGLDLSKVTSFGDMFGNCLNYTEMNLSGLDLSSVNDISYMFAGHSSLIFLDLGSFNINSDCKLDFMFIGCNSLIDINYAGTIEEWKAKNITNATTGIKEDGTITVHCSDGDYVIGGSTEHNTYSYTLKNPVDVLIFEKVDISFTSNNESFIGIQYSENGLEYFYEDGSSTGYIGSIIGEIDSKYLTLIFDIEPTGELKTWLENNQV